MTEMTKGWGLIAIVVFLGVLLGGIGVYWVTTQLAATPST